jgi:hypothetical protein
MSPTPNSHLDTNCDYRVIDAQPFDGAATVVQGYDVANFTDSGAVVPDYPIEVWADHDSLNLSALALGPKSSTLQRFVDHRQAPTKSFSIDFGSRSELYPRDGQVVFGGVNEARYNSSQRAEFPMWGAAASVNCPLQVLISDVWVTNANGSHSLFEDPDAKVSACIDTVQNAFTFTNSMLARFQSIGKHIDSDGSTYNQQAFPADREPLLGSLTIKLANGYTTVIPHYELITHERGTDAQGKYAVTNNTRIMSAVAGGASDLGANIPILGGVFLAQNYLHVDYDAGKFWLAPQVANGTLPDRIVSTCNSTLNPPNNGTTGDSGLGVKVGVPIAIIAVVLVAGAIWFFLRKRKQNALGNTTRAIGAANIESNPDSKSSMMHFGGFQSRRPSELQAEYHQRPGTQGTELHGETAWPRPSTQGEMRNKEEVPSYSPHLAHTPVYNRPEPTYYELGQGDSYEMPDTSPASPATARQHGDNSPVTWTPATPKRRPSEMA